MNIGFWIRLILWVIGGGVVLFWALPMVIMSYYLYRILLVRNKPDKWGRECSMPSDPIQQELFDTGMAWGAKYEEYRRSVDITNEGLHLYGEYFDFGSDKAVIILPGRMESCLYSYYFAEPYRAAGYNVLCIDSRAHGLSDGKYNTLGPSESRDVRAWASMLHEKLGVETVVLHGCCIGAAGAVYAAVSEECPDCVRGIVTDGMYATFYATFVNHMKKDKHPVFPFSQLVMLYIRIFAKSNVMTDGPIYQIGKLKKPILMIQSREDIYSLPHFAQEMYDKCGSEKKKLAWFPHGAHSRVRYADREGYDRTILEFLSEL